jgi:predicted NBD/HSP70 family sugar kinase
MPYDPLKDIAHTFQKEKKNEPIASSSERNILHIIRQSPGISRSEVTDRTELTQQSVYRLAEAMRERGLFIHGDPKPGTGRGQPSPTLFLNPDYAFTVGISVNTDSIGICIFNFAGVVLSTEMVDNFGIPLKQALERIKTSIDTQISKAKLNPERLFGVGFAIAGFLQSGTTYNTPMPLHEWSLIEIGPLISELLGSPVWTGNSANTAAVCEQMLGTGRYLSNFAYLSFNYGFGSAAIINSELLRGGHGNAGELGALFAHDDKRPALEFLLKRLKNEGLDISSVEYIRLNYDETWPGVDEWIDEVSDSLNRVVNALYAILDPQAIVLGGQIPKRLAQQLLERIEFRQQARHGVFMRTPRLLVSELDVDASSVGAAVMPLKAVF